MKIFFSIGFVFFTLCSNSQQLYSCEYTDSIGITNYEETVQNIRRSLEQKNVSPEIIDGYISTYFGNQDAFSMVQTRYVEVYADSSVIMLKYIPKSNFQVTFQLPSKPLIVKNRQLFRHDQSEGYYTKSVVPDSSQIFVKSNFQRRIHGFICDEYRSLDSTYTIWVSNQLPATVNPGVSTKNVSAAILGFEVKSGNGFTRSILTKIEKAKVII